jgi:hypothetical protein
LAELERLIRTDPARRGLISTEVEFGSLLPGHLGLAAQELASHATSVVIVTGFYIPSADPPAAETDGPLGAVLLAETLVRLGVTVQIVTDEECLSVARQAARYSVYSSDASCFVQTPESLQTTNVSHFIAVERVGPSHTLESLRRLHPEQPDLWKQFAGAVPETDRDHCFNMRGVCIDEFTAPLHRLFEASDTHPIKTIGIGDGGNEIGMGSIPWSEFVRRLPDPPGAKIACRVPCDYTIVAGVSNWGGYALAAAVAYLRGRVDILEPWTSTQQWEWLQAIVREGPAVDGVTRLQQPTVDGLPFATYIQPWDAMRQLLGLKR